MSNIFLPYTYCAITFAYVMTLLLKKSLNLFFSWYLENDGYNMIRSGRNRKGGGIDCYIKTSISFNYHRSLNEKFENILIDILLPKSKPITLGIIYRPPLTSQASLMTLILH